MSQIRPLFHDDLEDLKASLRLTGASAKKDVQPVIEDCVRGFKVWLTQRAGFDTIATIAAVPYVDEPTTELQSRRMAARVLEIKWVWVECLARLQTLFADASGAAFQQFNDQGVWRQLDALDRVSLVRNARREIEDLYCYVVSSPEGEAAESVQAFDGTTVGTEAFFPGGSVFCDLGKFRGNFLVPALRFDAEILRPFPEVTS